MDANVHANATGVDHQTDSHKGSTIFEPFQAVTTPPAPEALKMALDRPELSPANSLSRGPSIDRRNSLTPESPYKASDETRARQDLLDHDMSDVSSSLGGGSVLSLGAGGHRISSTPRASIHTSHSHPKAVNQVMGKASEMIGELAGIVAGVIPRHSQDGDDSVRFFVSSPETSRRESLQQGYSDVVRRASFTPESPYKVSDETRSRTNSIESEAALPMPAAAAAVTADEQPQAYPDARRTSAGSSSSKYERLG